jgi:RNA polymerase sigma-70 factor, ECF subfamily
LCAPEDPGGGSVIALDDRRRRDRLEDLTRQHGPFLRGLAGKLCRSRLDPDDLVQDVLEKVIRTVHAIPPDANERAWLARVLHNTFVDKLRRAATRREEAIDGAEPTADGEVVAWWSALTEDAVRAQVAKLPSEQRITFERFAFDRKSYDEIAAELGIAKATVGTRVLRARLKIRELLAAEHGDE